MDPIIEDAEAEAQRELDRALAVEVGMSPEQAEAAARGDLAGDERWKKATLGDIMDAIDLLTYFLKQSERATKIAGKLGGGGGNPANAMIAKMFQGK